MSNNELVDIECEIAIDMPGKKAIGVKDGSIQKSGPYKGKERIVWLPRSLTEDNKDGTVTIPRWLAEREELV